MSVRIGKLSFKTVRVLLLSALFATLAACASNGEMPTSLMAQAKTNLETAKSMNAADFAPLEYSQAEKFFNQAESAADEGQYTVATNLLEKSLLESRLATVKADAAKAEKAAEEIEQNLDTLRQEASNQATAQ